MKHFLKITGYSIGFMVLIQVCTPYSSFATTCENRSNNSHATTLSKKYSISIEKETHQLTLQLIDKNAALNVVEMNEQHTKKLKTQKKPWYKKNWKYPRFGRKRSTSDWVAISLIELITAFCK